MKKIFLLLILLLSYSTPAFAVGSVWEVAAATEPKVVLFDGTMGVLAANIGAVDAEYEWYWDANVLYVWSPDGTDPSSYYDSPGVEIGQRGKGIFATGKDYITISGLNLDGFNEHGIQFWAGCDNNIVENNTIKFCREVCLSFNTDGTANTYNTIQNNTISYGGEIGVSLMVASTHNQILNNDISYCGWSNDELYTAGIKLWCNVTTTINNNIIRGNEVHHNGVSTNIGSGLGTGIWLDSVQATSGNGNIITRNYTHDNYSAGIFNELTDYSIISFNLSDGDTANSDGYMGSISLHGLYTYSCDYNKVYNNTVLNAGERGFAFRAEDGTFNYNEIKNNIVDGYGTRAFYANDGAANDGVTGDNNVYQYNAFGVEGADFVFWDATMATYDAWETAYGGTTNSIETDPDTKTDGSLNGGSPAINAGTDPFSNGDGDQYDYAGTLVWDDSTDSPVGSWADGVEIGAYGYTATTVAKPAALLFMF